MLTTERELRLIAAAAMMGLSSRPRVGSLGSVAVFLALAFAGLISQEGQMVRAAYIANGLIAWYIILPLVLASLLIGVVQSLSTPWGLLRHYWVLTKLLFTIITIYVLLQQMDGISHMAGVAAETTLSGGDLLGLRRSLRTHAAGGLVVLLLLVGLSIYKPRGMTRYGWRRQQEERGLSQPRCGQYRLRCRRVALRARGLGQNSSGRVDDGNPVMRVWALAHVWQSAVICSARRDGCRFAPVRK